MATTQAPQDLSAKPVGPGTLLATLATSVDKNDGAASPMNASLQGQHSTVTAIAFSAQAQHSSSVEQLADRFSAAPGCQNPSEEPAGQQGPDLMSTTCSLAAAAVAQAPTQQQALRRSSRERRRTHPAWRDEEPAASSPASAAPVAAGAAEVPAVPAASGLASSQQDFSGLLLLIETAAALSGDAEADSAAPVDAAAAVTRQGSSNAADPAAAAAVKLQQQLQQMLPGCPEADPSGLQVTDFDAATSMAALAIHTLRNAELDAAAAAAEEAALPATLPRARPRKPDRSGIAAAVAAASSGLAVGSSYLDMLSAAAGLGLPGFALPVSNGKQQRKYTKLGDSDRSDSPAGRSRAPSSKKAAAAAGTGGPPAGSNAARRSAAAAAAATGAGLQVAPADGTGSLPNLKPRGQGRWQVFLCAQGLKYLYVGQYENLPDAKHARDLAVLAVHGPKLVPTLEPVSNYSESDIAAVRAQMAEKPAARAVMVANGLWPPQGMQGGALLHQPQQPRSRRLPGLQHTLQMIREEHKERMQQQQLAERKGSSSSCSSQAGAASSGSCGEPAVLPASASKQGSGRSRAGLQAAAEALAAAAEAAAAAAAVAAGSGRAAVHTGSQEAAAAAAEEVDKAAEAAAEATGTAVFEAQLAELVALAAAAKAAAEPAASAEAAAEPAAAAGDDEPAVTQEAAAAAAAAKMPSRATTPKPSGIRMARTSSGGLSSTAPGVAASLQHYHARATANPTGTTGIREHKGVFEVFLATPPFKYLYVGRANSLYDARRMKATAMMAVYGSEVAIEQFGAEPLGVTDTDVRLMAVKLSAKPAALAAMRQYGTDALLTEAEVEAAAAAQRRAGPAAQQQLAQVQLQLQVQAAQQAAAAAAAAEQQQDMMAVGEQPRRPSRRQQRQHEQRQNVSEVLAAAAERVEEGEQGLLPGSLPASNAAAMEIAAAAAKAQASIGGHRRSHRKRSAAAAFRLEQALLAAADEADGAAASGQESDATTGGLHIVQGAAAHADAAPAAKRRSSRGASTAGASMQAMEHQQQCSAFGSADMHAAEAAVFAAATGADEGDVDMADASLLALHTDPAAAATAAAAAVAGVLAEPSSSSRTSADGEACVSICTRRSMIAKDGRLGSHTTGKLGVRTHKGGYEAFIATPPFKYLYVGLYRTIQAAVQARDTAMLVVYGKEAAAALGVGPDSLASITSAAIHDMAARLAKKPQAVQAMQQYGTAHLLAGVGMGAGAGSSGGGSSTEVALQQLAAAAVAERLGAGHMDADGDGAAAGMEEQQQQQHELAVLQMEIVAMQQLAAQQQAAAAAAAVPAGAWLPGPVEEGAAIAY